MWNIKEEDLDEFRITCRHRLSPEGAMLFMFGGMLYSSLLMLFIFGALIRFGWDYYPTLFDTVMVRMELLLYSLQVIFFIIYLIPKVRFKFPSFYISWEEHERERQKRLKLYEEKEKRKLKK